MWMAACEARFKDAMICIPIVSSPCIYFVHTIRTQVLTNFLNRMAVWLAEPSAGSSRSGCLGEAALPFPGPPSLAHYTPFACRERPATRGPSPLRDIAVSVVIRATGFAVHSSAKPSAFDCCSFSQKPWRRRAGEGRVRASPLRLVSKSRVRNFILHPFFFLRRVSNSGAAKHNSHSIP